MTFGALPLAFVSTLASEDASATATDPPATEASETMIGLAAGSLDTPLPERALAIIGIVVVLGIAWLLSSDRKRVPWRLVGVGLVLQLALGLLVLRTGVGRAIFDGANRVFQLLLGFTHEGASFLFGNLVQQNVPVGEPVPGAPVEMAAIEAGTTVANTGAFFAFSVLPTIVFFSTLMALAYHVGLMQRVVGGIAWIMRRSMKTSGAETLSVAGNIFVGHTESPLLIRPFLGTLTMSELNTVMIGGFATVAGGVMAGFVGMLSGYFPDIAGHLLTASVMNAPAALIISKILLPETGEPVTRGSAPIRVERTAVNLIDAAADGAAQGLKLALNVGAMLLSFIALIALVNYAIATAGGWVGVDGLSLQRIFGWLLAPLAWILGVPWEDAGTVGSLIGIKAAVNEFVAYVDLAGVLQAGELASPRSVVIATYALLGFANFSAIAIQIGGIGGLAPDRRQDLSRLGLRAMVGGNLAAFLSAGWAGMIL